MSHDLITDCHIHIQPMEMLKPEAFELIKSKSTDFDRIMEFCRSPKAFLKYLDASGIGRAVLINYVAPEVIGLTSEVNQWVADYVSTDPGRLLSCGGLHPRQSPNVLADVEQILRLKIRMIKIHPPHQLLFPNDYLHGVKELEIIYRAAEANGVPVMFHTGTSIFHGARNKYGDPIYLDDVAVDFPKLKILMAHGGPAAVDGDRIFPAAAASQCVSGYQRHTAEDAAEILSPAGRNRSQDFVRNRLAESRRSGDQEQS